MFTKTISRTIMEVKERRPYSSLSKSRRHKEGPLTGQVLFIARTFVPLLDPWLTSTEGPWTRTAVGRRLSDLCPGLRTPVSAVSPPGLSGDCTDSQGLCVPTQKSYSSSETLKAFDQHQDQTRLELGLWLWGLFNVEWPGFNFLTRDTRFWPNLPPKTKRQYEIMNCERIYDKNSCFLGRNPHASSFFIGAAGRIR